MTEPTLKVSTLVAVCQLLLIASKEGAFNIADFTKIGEVYDEIATYSKFHSPESFGVERPSEPQEEQTEFAFTYGDEVADEDLPHIGVVLDEDGNIESFESLEPDNIIEGNFGSTQKEDSPPAA